VQVRINQGVPKPLDQISEDQSLSLAPSDSVSCLPNLLL